MFEASMNFDLVNVEPFLRRLDSQLELGLPLTDLVQMTHSTDLDDQRSTTVQVNFRGASAQLEYRVFMDDLDAPDVYFLTTLEALANAISDEFERFADELGI